MRRLIPYVLIILAVAAMEFACVSMVQAQTAGLNYQTYASTGPNPTYTQGADGTITNRTLLSTGTVSTINYQWGGGGVLNSGRGDGVIVRFYGFIDIPTAGLYSFGGNADDGLRITINNTSVVNSWIESGGAFRSGNVNLPAGVVPVEVMYYENGGGAMVNFQWYVQSTATWQIVPSTMLTTTAPVSQYPSYMTVGPNPGTMTYGTSAAITNQQQTRVNDWTARSVVDNTIYIDQVGDNNTINITQSGRANEVRGIGQQAAQIQGSSNTVTIRQGDQDTAGKNTIEMRVIGGNNTLNLNQSVTTTGASTTSSNNHYQSANISGSYNTVTTQQTNTGGVGGHYMETTISGNVNTVNAMQTNNANKTLFNTVTGNNNTVSVVQKDGGQHYLETTLSGNGNTVTAVQEGASANRASISITNSGGPGSVDLQQSGGANYNITTTCVTAGGCGVITVRQ